MNIVVLLSGEGTTLQAILDNCKLVNVVGVYSNNPDANGLNRARQSRIAHVFASHNTDDLFESLRVASIYHNVKLIVLAGYMKKISDDWIDTFDQLGISIINIHPSLLPSYKGLNTHYRVLHDITSCYPRRHGFTIHYVNSEIDGGECISSDSFLIDDDDTVESLEYKVKELERKSYPIIIDRIAQNENSFFRTKISN